MPQSENQPGRLAILSDEECWDLLRSQPVGRVAWSGLQGISVVPVNFIERDEAILLRTTAYSLLARDSVDREVAFEVDHLEPDQRTGWSVLVRGRCTRDEPTAERPEPWVTGPRHLGLRIDVRSISGRRILPASATGMNPGQTNPGQTNPGQPDHSGDEVCFTA